MKITEDIALLDRQELFDLVTAAEIITKYFKEDLIVKLRLEEWEYNDGEGPQSNARLSAELYGRLEKLVQEYDEYLKVKRWTEAPCPEPITDDDLPF